MQTRYRNRKKKKWKWRLIVLVVFVGMVVVGVSMRTNFMDYVFTYSNTFVRAQLVDSVNDATSEALGKSQTYGNYESLVDITRDSSDQIVSIHTDMLLINLFMCDVLECVQTNVDHLCEDMTLEVPIAAATGIAELAQFGPNYQFSIQPVGTADVRFRPIFQSVGINQTRHAIYIDISVKVEVLLPLETPEISLESELLLCENIIVGKVPDVYFGYGGGCMDLTP